MTNRGVQVGVLAVGLILGSSGMACTCKDFSLDEAVRNADYVFHAFVESAYVDRKKEADPLIRVRVTEVIPYKGGQPPVDDLQTPLQSSMCGTTISVGTFYWFFTDTSGTFTRCSYTQRASNEAVNDLTMKIADELERLRRSGKSPLN